MFHGSASYHGRNWLKKAMGTFLYLAILTQKKDNFINKDGMLENLIL